MSELKTYCLVRFSRKTGKIDTTLESLGCGMMEMWVLNHTPKTKDAIIFEKDTGNIRWYVEGTSDFPKVDMHPIPGNVEDYCPGLLAAVQ